ncbi:MAG: glycine oxidase ThiO [Moraxellaceae bacterium]|nr:glycine oxidase ThiO [Moraxellaceae bacterium]
MTDILIIGAGIMGMMTARELARAGRSVTVLERGEPGREASWAGGGIVSPLYPWRYSPAVTALARKAKRAYPLLVHGLHEETAIDAELDPCGMLMLDTDDARDALAWAAAEGETVVRHDREMLRQQWPWLADNWREGLFMPGIAQVRNPRFLQALQVSLMHLGVNVVSGVEVTGVKAPAGCVESVQAADGRSFCADQVIVCGGAWSQQILQEMQAPAALPVRPVLGQMLLYKLEPGILPCMVMAGGRYVIQRRDGHVLCGSTLEETGFDKSLTEEARISLMQSAKTLLPMLEHEKPIAQWSGLRPGSPNGIPYIGKLPWMENLWINTGHYRNGLVLAPASAQLLADLILQRPTDLDPAPYQYW